MTTALPAYGRNYANAAEAKRDWHIGKDFLESSSRRAFNRSDFPGDVVIRYGKQLEKVTSYTKVDTRKLDKVIAAEKAAQPAQSDTFEGWMKLVDAEVIKASGMSYQDLPDIDYYASYDAGVPPAMAAKEALDEAGF
jgi:hypothetical protein